MITITLSRIDAALLSRRLEDDRRLLTLTLAEMSSNLPDAIYAFRTEKQREELAHIDRVLAAIRAAQDAENAERSKEAQEMDMTRDNAIRLAGVLARYAEDDRAVATMARVLNYMPDQLRQDMAAVLPYLRRLEEAQDGIDV